MMDVELLAALAADNFELILVGSRFPPGTNGPVPTPQTMLDTGQGSDEERRENVRTLERGPPPPLRPSTRQHPVPASQHPACGDQQEQASPLDQQQRTGRLDKENQGQDRDSHTQPGSSR
jgi:hypothetical protein